MTESANIPTQTVGKPSIRADIITTLAILLVALLSSSFIARNSDLWLHLATGRMLANGTYQFGTDPFTHTMEHHYWANHSWLFDWGLYLAHEYIGSTSLVGWKSFLVVATTALMLLGASRLGSSPWITAACVLLAISAMGPRLLLQPTVCSFFLLSGCFYCLAINRFLSLIPVIVALWVNLDAFFIFGPILVALFWLGRRFGSIDTPQKPWPLWLVPATFAACLLSPHHIFAIQWPMELSPTVLTSGFISDPRFAGIFASPWRWYNFVTSGNYNPSAWAYLLLLTLGTISFAINRKALISWRGTVWLLFACLGAWQSRLIPFFAIVAAPITAINFSEIPLAISIAQRGRALTLAASLMMVAVASFGWTLGLSNRDRGVAWDVHTDQGLKHAAIKLKAWRELEPVRSTRTFLTHPDLGHYMAWFTPGERYFLDSRLQLFTHVANDYAAITRCTGMIPGETINDKNSLLTHSIGSVALYDPDPTRMTRAIAATNAGIHWNITRIEGGTIFLAPSESPFSLERPAFADNTNLPVAESGPGKVVEQGGWGQWINTHARNGSWPAETATICMRLAETKNTDSPSLPLMAVRAARCGTEIDPTDSAAWLSLGRAYITLGVRTWEKEAGADLAPLEYVRFIQATGALSQASLLNPDSATTHDTLARLFAQRNILDLANRHARQTAYLVRRHGRFSGETAEAYDNRKDQSQSLADSLEGKTQDAENRYIIRTVGQTGDPLSRARTAAELGLVQKAIDVLLAAHPDLYGAVGVGMLAEWLLQTGQFAECRVLLDRNELRLHPEILGIYNLPRRSGSKANQGVYRLPAYVWLDFCQCAAAGRYRNALPILDLIGQQLFEEEQRLMGPLTKGATSFAAGEVGLAASTHPTLARLAGIPSLLAINEFLARVMELSATRADLITLAGVLELERGNPNSARERFRTALGIYSIARSHELPRPGEPLAARYDKTLGGGP